MAAIKEYYAKHLETCQRIVEKTETADDYDDLAAAYYKLSSADGEREQQLLGQAIAIYEMLAEKYPSVARYRKNLDIMKQQKISTSSASH